MSIADNLKAARLKLGLTQKQVSQLLGTSQQSYAQYETGKRIPKIETLIKLSEALCCRPEDIADYEHFPYMDFRPGLFDNYVDLIKGSPTDEEKKVVFDEIERSERNALITARENITNDLYFLNRQGLEKAAERVHELTEIPRYRNDNETPGSASAPVPAAPEKKNKDKSE